jgi:hypothetical protein
VKTLQRGPLQLNRRKTLDRNESLFQPPKVASCPWLILHFPSQTFTLWTLIPHVPKQGWVACEARSRWLACAGYCLLCINKSSHR